MPCCQCRRTGGRLSVAWGKAPGGGACCRRALSHVRASQWGPTSVSEGPEGWRCGAGLPPKQAALAQAAGGPSSPRTAQNRSP